MKELLASLIKKADVDYLDIRIEKTEGCSISFLGRNMEDIGKSYGVGGSVRALHKGGWGFVSFNNLDDLKDKVDQAVKQAKFVGNDQTMLYPVDPVDMVIRPEIIKDPRSIPLSDKKNLLEYYNNKMLHASPEVQTTRISYTDTYKKIYYANSDGTYLDIEKMDAKGAFVVITRSGDLVQQGSVSWGTNDDYGAVERMEDKIDAAVTRALSQLKARPVKGGKYTVILDPVLAGVFIHESFGHLSEADSIYNNEKMKELFTIGKRFGPDILNVVDSGLYPNQRGTHQFDDEGVPAHKTYLIQNGILTGRLHSRETAARMGEKPTGNARCLNYRFAPIVRMTNTYIEAGKTPFRDLIGDVKEGIYARRYYGGMTNREIFTFSAAEAYMIRNGKVEEPVRDVVLTGNVFETLHNIDGLGDTLGWPDGGGGCGKAGQSPLPVGMGGPNLKIKNVIVGGK
ncbi:MAG: TldD/PmbA family protein [Candidatus Sericytochromatia bacterium]|nr:TldD/PmbA family protein [Candidatus Sericytochromatia bacterium]